MAKLHYYFRDILEAGDPVKLNIFVCSTSQKKLVLGQENAEQIEDVLRHLLSLLVVTEHGRSTL